MKEYSEALLAPIAWHIAIIICFTVAIGEGIVNNIFSAVYIFRMVAIASIC